jgi:hypothetical protein
VAALTLAAVVAFPGAEVTLRLGQPAAIAIGSLLIGLFLFRRRHLTLRAVALFVSLALKPPLSLPIVFYVLLKRRYLIAGAAALDDFMATKHAWKRLASGPSCKPRGRVWA